MMNFNKIKKAMHNLNVKGMAETTANLTSEKGEKETTNVFIAGDTPVLTNKGYARIDDLVNEAKPVSVWNGKDFSNLTPKVTGENQPLLEVRFSDGIALKCSPHQKFILADGSGVEAEGLKVGDVLTEYTFPIIFGDEELPSKVAYTAGFFSGDGSIETNRKRNSIWLYGRKRDLLDQLDHGPVNECAGEKMMVKIDADRYRNKTFVPDAGYTIESRLEWLAGLLDSDGTYQRYSGFQITSIDKGFLMRVKFLLNTLGVRGHFGLCKDETTKMMPDGKGGMKEYPCKTCYRLGICESAARHLVSLGLNPRRVGTPKTYGYNVKQKSVSVVSVKALDEIAEKVYGFGTPKESSAIAIDFKEAPSPPYEECAA